MSQNAKVIPTLCWDCANATGGCLWSDVLIPVKGWTAYPTPKKENKDSYLVVKCPEFIRDATGGGLHRYRGDNNEAKEINL